MNTESLVSFVLLSWNRIEDVRDVLQRLREDPWPNKEIIVVDNASSDGTVAMLQAEFPDTRVVQLAENIGIAGWNEGFAVARGTYVFVLDDDSYPVGDAVRESVRYMEQHPRCGVLGLRIYNERFDQEETAGFSPGEEKTFIGCGAVIRHALIKRIGGFDRRLFLYEHEREYTLRTLNSGFTVEYLPTALVHHRASAKNRGLTKQRDGRRVYYTLRNILYVMLLHFPLRKVLFRVLRIAMGRTLGAAFRGCGWSAVCGVVTGFRMGLRHGQRDEKLTEEVSAYFSHGRYAGGFFFDDPAYSLRRPRFLGGSMRS